jgi:hypothetical protein
MTFTFLRADDAAWGSAIRTAAHLLAEASVLCFAAGLHAGELIHAANDQLAAAYRCLLVGAHRAESAAEQVVEQVVAAAPRLERALTDWPIQCLTVLELRSLARQQLGSAARIEGRRIAQANRAGLLLALGAA